MRSAILLLALAVMGCGSDGKANGSLSPHFEYTRVSSDQPPILLETTSGCSWLLLPDWKIDEGQKEVNTADENDVAEAFGKYALVQVATGDGAKCERFGLAVPHGAVPKKSMK